MLVLTLLGQFVLPNKADAQTYTATYVFYESNASNGGGPVLAYGWNTTEGFETALSYYWGTYQVGS